MKNKTKALLLMLCALTLSCAFTGCDLFETPSSNVDSSVVEESTGGDESTGGETDDSSDDTTDSGSGDSSDGGEVVAPTEYTVTVNACEGATVEVADKVEENKDVSFTVTIANGYEKGTDFALTATVGGEAATVSEAEGTYTVSAVKGDVVINVAGVVKKNFNVVKEADEGAVINGADSVVFGEDYYFTVSFETGYAADDNFEVLIEGEPAEYDETEEKYVVRNVSSGFMIEVKGVKEVIYNVSYACDYEDALLNQAESLKGTSANYVCKINLSEKYTQCIDSIEVYYSIAGVETKVGANENQEYVIANPQSDMVIVVKNVSLNTYKVDFLLNGEVKYTQQGITVGTALTDEQLVAAKEAVMQGVDGTFVGWGESLGLVKADSELNAVVAEGETENLGNGFASATEVDGAPIGYEKAYKETATWSEASASAGGAKTVWANVAEKDIEPYKTIYFQMKVEKSWILFDGWSHYLANGDSQLEGTIAVWTLIKLEKADKGWNVTFNGTTTFREGMYLNEILTFEYDARTVELGFEDCVPAEISVTDMIAVKDENYVEGVREVATEQIFSNSTLSEEAAPRGYSKVYYEKAVWDASKQSSGGVATVWADIANCEVSKYKQLTFQVKVSGSWILFDGWSHYFSSNNEWVTVSMEKTELGWNISFGGTTTSRVGTNLKDLLKMEFDARTVEDGYADCVPSEIWATEIIGVLDENYVEAKLDKIADSAYEVGIDVGGGAQFTATTEIAAASGFENVYKYQSTEYNIHGKSFCGVDLTAYKTVTFALKTASFNFNGEATKEMNDWMIFTLTQTSTAMWDLKVTCNGEVIFEKTGLNGAYDSAANPAYSNNALDAILYGNPSGFYPQVKDGDLTVYVSELLGEKNADYVDPTPDPDPEPTLIGEKIAESAYLANTDISGSQFTATTEIAAATGFENVYKYQSSTAGNIHGMNFDGTDLTAYKTVTFALKTASFNFNGEATKEMNDWMIFTLTQTSTATWDLKVTCNGEVIFEKTGLNGAYNSVANPAYSNNAIDAILYGNPAGFYPQAKDGDLTVYVTEIRGEKA